MLLLLGLLACQIGNKKKSTTVADRGFYWCRLPESKSALKLAWINDPNFSERQPAPKHAPKITSVPTFSRKDLVS